MQTQLGKCPLQEFHALSIGHVRPENLKENVPTDFGEPALVCASLDID
jgi:hypothetical protein